MDEPTRLRADLRALAADLAAIRVATAFARCLDGRKYDPHPVRQPPGTQIDGRSVGGQS